MEGWGYVIAMIHIPNEALSCLYATTRREMIDKLVDSQPAVELSAQVWYEDGWCVKISLSA